MGLSFASGGVIERSGLFESLPETFSSIWMTMGFLLVVLVGIGMIMDPFGAVVLVTGTVAQVAYHNGVDPVHFWMLTLVAFELGYLTPPVALNHLLTRQVVGEEEAAKATAEVVGQPFWYRHEKILLPLSVMGVTLLIVAFVPIILGYS
jgi:TRAP-type C4-dicarboxylate transport system permease large subunit